MYRNTILKSILLALSLNSVVAQEQDPTASQATTTDPNECQTYPFPLITEHQAEFPESGKKATILSNDSVARAKWEQISAAGTIPQIVPKPTSGGAGKYDPNDPDCWWTYNGCTTPKREGVPPDVAIVPEPSTLGYGFDDGPFCGHNAFYDYLKSQNQKATMYFIGSNVYDWPLEAQRALTDGHEICIHTWSHPYMTSLQNEDVFAEMYYAHHLSALQIVKLVVGVTSTCWRPPYGDIDDRVRAIAAALGLQTIMWEYDSEDADVGTSGVTKADVDKSYQGFIATAKNGSFTSQGAILLEHEVDNFTISKAMEYYPQLKEAFTFLTPVGVALNKTKPYLETDYSLPSFEQYIAGLTTVSPSMSVSSEAVTPTGSPLPVETASSDLSNGTSARMIRDTMYTFIMIGLFSVVAFL
ncbi:carbohydrate esterase family 4 protein [Moniliophthora roreri MCA 2997]|uniref:chitin deacetylase n=2 Tax=Moniliophthora roreri TaxID=221103 RepID=V2YRN5_MONRO|nr:carbohydrate esterase family 4 protein [Moniliophthora roreri MCA 2997]